MLVVPSDPDPKWGHMGISPGDEWGRMGMNGTPRGGTHPNKPNPEAHSRGRLCYTCIGPSRLLPFPSHPTRNWPNTGTRYNLGVCFPDEHAHSHSALPAFIRSGGPDAS